VFGISSSEFVILVVVAAVVLGPERLPRYAQQLARLIRELRRMAQGATEQVRSELGPEFDEVDWRKLDPRQYDPRRIVREALADTIDPNDPLGLNVWKDDLPVSWSDMGGSGPGGRAGSGRSGSGRHAAPPQPAVGGSYPVLGTTAPGSTVPGSTVPGSTVPGSTVPGSTAPGSTAPGTTAPADVPFDPDAT
jgi:sec-independent protein translocase protein TatB